MNVNITKWKASKNMELIFLSNGTCGKIFLLKQIFFFKDRTGAVIKGFFIKAERKAKAYNLPP